MLGNNNPTARVFIAFVLVSVDISEQIRGVWKYCDVQGDVKGKFAKA